MKNVLITGAGSYIGSQFEKYMQQFPQDYCVDVVDMLDGTWCEKSFSGYDVVFHVAGLAHQKETKKNAPLYYHVNRDLVYSVAQKAKADGVGQFVFLSSMSVYGIHTGIITENTVPAPKSHYGKSKLEAEELLRQMESSQFRVAILRPPMVYGEECRGNYQLLKKFALKSPVFPKIQNRRSMICIERLCQFVKEIMDTNAVGLFFPQDPEYVCTSDMVAEIAKQSGRKICLTKAFNFLIYIFRVPVVQKVFGDLVYQMPTKKE